MSAQARPWGPCSRLRALGQHSELAISPLNKSSYEAEWLSPFVAPWAALSYEAWSGYSLSILNLCSRIHLSASTEYSYLCVKLVRFAVAQRGARILARPTVQIYHAG